MMKKLFLFGMMGAMALTFGACSSEEDIADVNPTFDGKAVKTQFSISLPGSYATRMTDAATQAAGTLASYRGIDVLKIYAFGATETRTGGEFTIKSGTMFSGTPINLTGIAAADLTGAVYDKWYEATVPLGTTAFLVYGKPTTTEGGALDAYYKTTKDGALTTTSDKAGDLHFDLVSIAGADYAFDDDGADLLDALNTLPGVTGKPNAATDEKAWSEITEAENAAYYQLYQKFITLTAGSKTSVNAMLVDLLASVDKATTGVAENAGIDYKLKTAITNAINNLGSDFTSNKGLPDGAAKLVFDPSTKKFGFADTKIGVIGETSTWKVGDYVKPAELYYRANTPIRVAPEMKSDKVETAGTWAKFLTDNYAATAKTVDATTQSVALVDELQYAVGNLATFVRFANSELEENIVVTPAVEADEVAGTPAVPAVYRKVTLPTAGLELTGILVGGQKNVDFEFLPTGDNEYTIYDPTIISDNKMITTAAFGTAPAAYTLVLETAEATNKVRIALEFINTLSVTKTVDGVTTTENIDFYGVNNQIIPYGTKFYLVGELDLTKLEDADKKIDQIFKQDYMTKIKLTISSLKNAYNVVPDLRTPKLELGMAVNLEWQEGNVFEVTIQ